MKAVIIKLFHMQFVLVVGLIFISLLSGCSNIKTYPAYQPENIRVETKADSGSFFTDIKTSLHIYSVNNECKTSYLGTVNFNKAKNRLGLPANKLLYLEFTFVNSGFFVSRTSSMSYDTLLKPRKGAQYNIELSYLDDMYNMEIWEKRSKKSSKRELDARSFDSCKNGK